MKNTKKILIFYNAIGLGHKKIAENIDWLLEQQGHKVYLENILKVQENALSHWGQKIHKFINLYLPFVWNFLYTNSIFINLTLPFRIKVASRNSEKTLNTIKAYNPDIVICTHTIASAIIAFLKKKKLFQGRFGIAFSDYHLHKYWLYEQVDFYLVNTEEQKMEMENFGIYSEKIYVTGVTLKSVEQYDQEYLRVKYQLKAGEKIILVSSGSLGWGNDEEFLVNLSQKFKQSKIIVVCGKNEVLYKKFVNIFTGSNVLVLGFVENMTELYAVADIFLTKPGGLSIAEALQFKLPIVITHKLPGQEQKNLDYLLEKGLVVDSGSDLFRTVQLELETGKFKKSLVYNENLDKILNKKTEIFKII